MDGYPEFGNVFLETAEIPVPPTSTVNLAEKDGPAEPALEKLVTTPVELSQTSQLLFRVNLPRQLDKHLAIPELLWNCNRRHFYASTVICREKEFYLAFTPSGEGETLLAPADKLHQRPVDIQLAPDTRYRISLRVNIFDPFSSKLTAAPAPGFSGLTHITQVRRLQELIRKYSIQFNLPDAPYLFLYGHDADGETLRLAETKSFFFIKDKETDSKCYVVGEEGVPVGQWVEAEVGPNRLLLFRPEEEILEVHTK